MKFFAGLLFLFFCLLPVSVLAEYKIPDSIINIENLGSPYFTINKNVGAFFDFDFGLANLGQKINVNSASLKIYLEKGENIPPESEFIIYSVDIDNNKISDGILISASTVPQNFVDFLIPIDKVSVSSKKIGFVVYPISDGNFTFHDGNHWALEGDNIEKSLFFQVTFIEEKTIRSMISEYLPPQKDTEEQILDLIKNTDKNINDIKRDVKGNLWSQFIWPLFISLIFSGIFYLLVYPKSTKRKKIMVTLLFFAVIFILAYIVKSSLFI
jgi:hypothetical protein